MSPLTSLTSWLFWIGDSRQATTVSQRMLSACSCFTLAGLRNRPVRLLPSMMREMQVAPASTSSSRVTESRGSAVSFLSPVSIQMWMPARRMSWIVSRTSS